MVVNKRIHSDILVRSHYIWLHFLVAFEVMYGHVISFG